MFEDHIYNQKYINYIQPLNQDLFGLIHSRMSDLDNTWYRKKILDYGCNNANLLKTSRNLIDHKKYLGIDVQQTGLDLAKKLFNEANFIHFNGYHVAFNPQGTDTFPKNINFVPDIIICHGVFTHCDMHTIKNTIEFFKSIIKKTGFIIFSLWEDFHLPQYAGIFLKNRLNIEIPSSIYKTSFDRSFYLINREYSIIDKDILPIRSCNWIETFYTRDAIEKEIEGIIIPEGFKAKHTIIILPV